MKDPIQIRFSGAGGQGLITAGVILSEAAMLVRRRGEFMQSAVPAGVGAMAAVMNVSGDDLKKRCAAKSKPGRVVEVVNFNSPQQLVVAGHKGAVEDLCQALEAESIRFVMLQVSAPFHSPLMAPVQPRLTEVLRDMRFDEALLRQAYYQTLLPVYQTNTNGNGRADMMRMAQVVSSCAPKCLAIPIKPDGKRAFKLGLMAAAKQKATELGALRNPAYQMTKHNALGATVKLIRDTLAEDMARIG